MTREERMEFIRAIFDDAFADVGYPEDAVKEIVDRWEQDIKDAFYEDAQQHRGSPHMIDRE